MPKVPPSKKVEVLSAQISVERKKEDFLVLCAKEESTNQSPSPGCYRHHNTQETPGEGGGAVALHPVAGGDRKLKK